MDLIHLDIFLDSLRSLVCTVAELPTMVPDSFCNPSVHRKLTNLCLQFLKAALRPEHGDRANSAIEVLKSLSPLIMLAKSEVRMFAFCDELYSGCRERVRRCKESCCKFAEIYVQKAPENSELRASAVESIMEIFRALEHSDQVSFVEYVVKMTEGKSSFRLLAVDLIVPIVMSLKDPLGVQANEVNDPWGLRCLQVLVKGGSDLNSAIRACSLSNLVVCCKILKEVLGIGDGVSQKTEATINNLSKIQCLDEKAAVRKAALNLVTKLTSFYGGSFDEVLLKTMGMACSDPLVVIRKAAVSALSEVRFARSINHHGQLLDKTRVGCEIKTPLTHGDWHDDNDDAEPCSVTCAGDRVFLLQTMSNISLELPPDPAADLAHNLLKRIEGFDTHPTEVNAHVKVHRTVWVRQLLSRATQVIEKYISEDTQANEEGSFFTLPRSGNRRGRRSMTTSELLSQATIAAYKVGSLVIFCPSVDLSTVIPLLHEIITSGDLHPKSKLLPAPQVSLKHVAASLYLQGWLTLGKICFMDGKIAKRYILLFVQELEKSDSATLRNNLVVMMADFCVRYTALIDCHIVKITRCLGDPCELVRRQTFILLDYVKWRGVLFLRILLSLVHESEKIRELADFLFGNILRVKAPLLAYNSFVEAIFVLKDCCAHGGHYSSQSSQSESRLLFSIRGTDEISRSKRMRIYTCLLKQMAPEHLLATFAKICADILAAASDGMLNIEDATGQSVLQETGCFSDFACKEIRLPTSQNSTLESPEMDDESNGSGGTSPAAAEGWVISPAVRKSLIRNTIPIFIELKRLLESKNSLLTGSLMDCLRLLLKDYKNELDEILVADKQLQRELLHDMQKHEFAKARSEAAETVAVMEKSGNNHTPQASNAPSGVSCQNKSSNELQSNSRVASAPADAVAEATAYSLKEPRVRSCNGATGSRGTPSNRPREVLESLRRQPFCSDDEG
ncbi:hypothetical protein EUGRSUZ_C00337 [Eucalyptus grandis]|uniref:Uncharacterized protein n=1 Tax=Eucalyptus grandis TaxID=71139 RepID=A0ACC3L9H5_EUCGR|nr:hypothetical protein EUGRSUZ_C00337 [Eucalyptus grandis]